MSWLLRQTVVTVEGDVALLSNGNVVVFVTCPSCGERFLDVIATDWEENTDSACPTCGEMTPDVANPFYEDCPAALPAGLPWTGDIPKVGMSFEGILKRERQ
jgi:predicted RNA-binding Zn-ribbon protein involved in translation (DUF1610 family)